MRVQPFSQYWVPVFIWAALISIGSTDLMSAEHSSRFIAPFLRWLRPEISAESIAAVQLIVRKLAHLAEYGILAALLARALRAGTQKIRFAHALLVPLLAGAFAALDEYHQSFIPSRTGSPIDVAIDCGGAVAGLVIYSVFTLRKSKNHDAGSSSTRSSG